jgi:DoxX
MPKRCITPAARRAVVCGPDGVAIFDALHRRGTVSEAMLYAFDLLEFDGEDLRDMPLGDRKKRLARLLAGRRLGIVLSDRTDEDGTTIFRQACLFSDEFKLHLPGGPYDFPAPAAMAFLSGCGEIVFPVLLVLGLGTRFAALGVLFMTCIVELTVPDGWPIHITRAAMALAIMAGVQVGCRSTMR